MIAHGVWAMPTTNTDELSLPAIHAYLFGFPDSTRFLWFRYHLWGLVWFQDQNNYGVSLGPCHEGGIKRDLLRPWG